VKALNSQTRKHIDMIQTSESFDLAVIGGGSGGIGAALAAARRGLNVVLIERGHMLGGTATIGGVNVWEMGAGGTGIPFDIYQRLKQIPDAVGIYSNGRHFCLPGAHGGWPHDMTGVSFPGGENVVDPGRQYIDTLRRHVPEEFLNDKWLWAKENWHGVPFEPDAFHSVVMDMFSETGNCAVRLGTALIGADAQDGIVRKATLSDGHRISATSWVDGTGCGALCRMSGCEQLQGIDSKGAFGEDGAPDEHIERVNAPTLIFRVAKTDTPEVEPLPPGIPADFWWRDTPTSSCVNHYPNGDRNINMLPTMEGPEFLALGWEKAYAECRRRIHCHWHFLQTNFPEFQYFRMHTIFPMLGVRESWRTVCDKMLTEGDIVGGLHQQTDPDIIAIADHSLDRHGQGGACPEVLFPYGIPYRCLVPRGYRNLLIACRGAGFSSIAASSARLSRTMMQLGQAAGNAVVLARELGCPLPAVNPQRLRERLCEEHVQLEFPLTDQLQAYIVANQ
jgi:hypothetical protein